MRSQAMEERIAAAMVQLDKARNANARGRDGAASAYCRTATTLLNPVVMYVELPQEARAYVDPSTVRVVRS